MGKFNDIDLRVMRNILVKNEFLEKIEENPINVQIPNTWLYWSAEAQLAWVDQQVILTEFLLERYEVQKEFHGPAHIQDAFQRQRAFYEALLTQAEDIEARIHKLIDDNERHSRMYEKTK